LRNLICDIVKLGIQTCKTCKNTNFNHLHTNISGFKSAKQKLQNLVFLNLAPNFAVHTQAGVNVMRSFLGDSEHFSAKIFPKFLKANVIVASCAQKAEFVSKYVCNIFALAAWRSGHRIRLRKKRIRVRFQPWYNIFSET
jgi:hypothetical protein